MVPKKLVTFAIFSIIFAAAIYLLLQLNRAYDEFSHWKSREAVLEKELDDLTLKQFGLLTETEVRTLVVDDKWIASLSTLMQSEIDAISQRLTGRIKELAERYENTLGELTTSTKSLEENVSTHLKKMGLVWN